MSFNFRSTPSIMRSAVVYMIGQMEAMGLECSTADIAAFCKCTKMTARKHLNAMEKHGTIRRVQNVYRKNAKRDTWMLSQRSGQALAIFAAYKANYDMVMASKMEMLSIPF